MESKYWVLWWFKMNKWVVVKWIEKKAEHEGTAFISPIEEDGTIIIGLSILTEIPNETFNVIGEVNDR